MKNLLLIDDDTTLVSLLSGYLNSEGFNIDVAYDGEKGLHKFLENEYDLVMLDTIMPRMNGFEVLNYLKQKNTTPVLMFTEPGDEADKLLEMEIGADSYIVKPFSERELLIKIRALLRNTQYKTTDTSNKISHLDIEYFPTQQQVQCQGFTIDLTSSELLLLEYFLKFPGQLVSKIELSEQALGKRTQVIDRSIDMHLSNLRRKLPNRLDGQTRIKNIRGQGYMWLETIEE